MSGGRASRPKGNEWNTYELCLYEEAAALVVGTWVSSLRRSS